MISNTCTAIITGIFFSNFSVFFSIKCILEFLNMIRNSKIQMTYKSKTDNMLSGDKFVKENNYKVMINFIVHFQNQCSLKMSCPTSP